MIEHRDCAAIDEMLPAYAVDGLDEADRAFVEAHLLSCDRHEDAAAWGDIALRLADLAPAVTPPERLRARILGIPHADAEPVAGDEPIAEDEVVAPVPVAPMRDTERPAATPIPMRRNRLPYALAAVFAALAVFFSGWTAILLTGGDDAPTTLAASASAGGIEANASFIADEQVVLVRLSGLTPLPDGSDYQLWAIGPGQDPTPAGILAPEGGDALSSVSGQFEAGWTFAVTVEPAGGSPAPTSTPIIAVTF